MYRDTAIIPSTGILEGMGLNTEIEPVSVVGIDVDEIASVLDRLFARPVEVVKGELNLLQRHSGEKTYAAFVKKARNWTLLEKDDGIAAAELQREGGRGWGFPPEASWTLFPYTKGHAAVAREIAKMIVASATS
jgi:hypothetical protein